MSIWDNLAWINKPLKKLHSADFRIRIHKPCTELQICLITFPYSLFPQPLVIREQRMSQIPGGQPALVPRPLVEELWALQWVWRWRKKEDQHHTLKPREDSCSHPELEGEWDILIGSASETDLFPKLLVLRDLVLVPWVLAMSDPHAQGLKKSHFPHTVEL